MSQITGTRFSRPGCFDAAFRDLERFALQLFNGLGWADRGDASASRTRPPSWTERVDRSASSRRRIRPSRLVQVSRLSTDPAGREQESRSVQLRRRLTNARRAADRSPRDCARLAKSPCKSRCANALRRCLLAICQATHHRLRRKTHFVMRFNRITGIKTLGRKYISFVFTEIDIVCPRPASARGTYRDRHGR